MIRLAKKRLDLNKKKEIEKIMEKRKRKKRKAGKGCSQREKN